MAERPGPEGIIEGTPLSTRRDKPWRLKDGVLRHDQAILAEEIIWKGRRNGNEQTTHMKPAKGFQ